MPDDPAVADAAAAASPPAKAASTTVPGAVTVTYEGTYAQGVDGELRVDGIAGTDGKAPTYVLPLGVPTSVPAEVADRLTAPESDNSRLYKITKGS